MYKEDVAMIDEKHIRTLLDKYINGDTTAAEEQELRRSFAENGGDVAADLIPYRALFAYIDAEKRPEAVKKPVSKAAVRRLRVAIAIAAAAAVALIVVMTYARSTPDCYAVIDGKVYTDSRTVNAEAMEALKSVSADYSETFDALNMMQ